MEQDKPAKRDHELEDLDDFGKVKFDPDAVADTPEEQAELDTERYYQPRDDKPSAKRAPGGAGNPETPGRT
ncbi:MAG: hypothetical protein P0Y56_01605 [Candidatus Andeanibacterium colombiense]|uniref:Uncharacterized protein n=1 Tax=Candidatus Andeanibacterium colombiense TaxID=3121345 RepID=A0AAJ5X702_9SPHN|nr:MAG: hypothetical protein P0Y56_01605 [Sphingomonadaceae bacterium]